MHLSSMTLFLIYPTQTLIRNDWYGCVFCLSKTKSGFWESATFWAGYIFYPRNNFNESGEKYIKYQIIKIYSIFSRIAFYNHSYANILNFGFIIS